MFSHTFDEHMTYSGQEEINRKVASQVAQLVGSAL
jgi:hypothetical protein